MKRVGRAVEFLAWTLFFAFAALVLALRFWLLPDIERYRDDIVAAVSRTVGQPVRIGGIEAGWLGLNPRIDLTDVRIQDREGREALVLPAVQNVVSWSSLLRGKLRLHSLVIEGLRLQVRRDAEGAFYVAGTKLGGGGNFSDWVLSQEEIVIRNAEIEWHDELRGAPPLALSSLNLRLRNQADQHSLGFTAHPPAALGSTIELRAVLDGSTVADPTAWNGKLYAELGYTDLAAWRPWIDHPWSIDRGQGAVRLWLTLEGGEAKQATADVALAGVSARLGAELAPLNLSSVVGRLQGRMPGEGYEFVARGLALELEGGASIAPTDFQLSWKPDAAGSKARGSLAASVIELEPLAQLVASLPLPAGARKRLADFVPRGRLADTRLEWVGAPDAPERFTAKGKFSGLAAAPWGEVPGFAGIAGSFEATEATGRVHLATTKSELNLPRVFPEPRIALDVLNGQVEWELQGERGFAVRISSLTFANPHFSGNAHGSYSYSGSGPGYIDLSAQFNRADAAHTARYLPHARLMGGDKTRDWVANAIQAGQAGDVRVRIQGDLREFPFADPLRGQFSVLARIDKGVLNYVEGWPRIQDINGELLFERDRMEVVGRSASILGVALADVRVGIPRLAERNPQLAITGQADGATADFLKFIDSSPVRRMIGGFTDPMRASGRGKLRLRLDLALKDLSRTRVAGEYEFGGNSIVAHTQLPAIERAAGKVAFTESTLTVHDVRGNLFGGPVAINGGTRSPGAIEITAKGEATVAGIAPIFDHPWRRFLSGAAPYAATLNIAEGRTRIRFETLLRGVESTLPPPLAKAAADNLPLRIEIAPSESGDRISMMLDRIAAVELTRRRQGDAMVVQRTSVALTPAADKPLRQPERTATLIYGSLPALDGDKWLSLFAGGEKSADTAAFDLRIGRLDIYGKRVNDVALRGTADAAGWSAAVKAQELAGDLAYRSERGGRLVARLTHFRTPEEYPGAPARAGAQPDSLPSMDLIAERFTLRGKELGRVELAAQRAGEDWRIDRLTMANPHAAFTGSGVWRSGTPSRTALDFELQANDAGHFLARIGYPDLVKGGKAQMKGSLAWNGDPALLDYPSLSGEVQLHADHGQFLEIEPGLGKLISLMSLQSLPRRITLDFRDVFSKGFEFERISSSARVEGGVMAVQEFRMRGSAAQAEMNGIVDLARETQNLRVRVVPSLGDSASTVIALVNPLLAIPAAIAQKILKDPLGHIFAWDYSVTGSWTDPKVAKLGIEARAAEVPAGQ